MEKRKIKFLLQPITQEGISKYGRKSKFIFKLKNDPIPCDDVNVNNANFNHSQNFSEKNSPQLSHSNGTMEEKPSIILCKTNSIMDDEPFERKLDIEYPSVINIKKIEISSNPPQICKIIKSNKVSVLQKKHSTSKRTVILPSQSGGTNMPLKNISFKRIKLEKYTTDESKINSQKDAGDANGRVENNNSTIQDKLPSTPDPLLQKHGKKNLTKKSIEQKSSSSEQKSNAVQNQKDKIIHITGNSPNKLENDIQLLVGERVKTEEIRLKSENEKLLQKMNELKVKLEKASEVRSYQRERLTLSKLKLNQEMLYYYIGFKDISLVSDMAKKLKDYFVERELPSSEILIEEQLIMTLMKLRRNYSLHDLAFRFRIVVSEAYCIIFNIVHGLHYIYYEQGLSNQPFPLVDTMQPCLSEQFQNFPNCRVVLESFRVGCEDPDCEIESDLFTSFKFDRKIMLKGLIAITPTKQVVFCSGLYEGNTSNAYIFKDSEILNKLSSGDLIMADKTFDEILKVLPADMDLNITSSKKSLLTDKQIKHLNSKARAYIGRTTMQHLRRFTILNCMPSFLNPVAVKVFQVCATLVNLQPTICGQSDTGFSEQ